MCCESCALPPEPHTGAVMERLASNIKITLHDGGSDTAVRSVKTVLGNDITDRFISYCKTNSLPIGNREEIESATIYFLRANSDWLV